MLLTNIEIAFYFGKCTILKQSWHICCWHCTQECTVSFLGLLFGWYLLWGTHLCGHLHLLCMSWWFDIFSMTSHTFIFGLINFFWAVNPPIRRSSSSILSDIWSQFLGCCLVEVCTKSKNYLWPCLQGTTRDASRPSDCHVLIWNIIFLSLLHQICLHLTCIFHI